MRLWGGRFGGAGGGDDDGAGDDSVDGADGADGAELAASFGRSIDVDAALALDDLDGSAAHVRGLGRAGILTDDEVATLVAGLADLRRDVESGDLKWDPALEIGRASCRERVYSSV